MSRGSGNEYYDIIDLNDDNGYWTDEKSYNEWSEKKGYNDSSKGRRYNDWSDKKGYNDSSKRYNDSSKRYNDSSKGERYNDFSVEKEYKEKNNRRNSKDFEFYNQLEFIVPLSFQQELIMGTGGTLVPLSKTSQNNDHINGVLKLKFNKKLSQMSYRLYVYNAINPTNKITAAHLHAGAANQNGPVILDLYNGLPHNVNGELDKGIINNNSVINTGINGYNFNSIASIYEGIRRGIVYVNVHSEKFPNGVVRGQIFIRNK